MVRLFIAMVARIKRHLPAARISLDISPWIAEIGEWMRPFLEHGSVDYVHTSGGRTTAASTRIRGEQVGNPLTWAELHRLSGGRGIIADTGYGIGGRLTTESQIDAAWRDAEHLRARMNDGVIAVTFAEPGPGWTHTVSRLRRDLPPSRSCFGAAAGDSAGRLRRQRLVVPSASTLHPNASVGHVRGRDNKSLRKQPRPTPVLRISRGEGNGGSPSPAAAAIDHSTAVDPPARYVLDGEPPADEDAPRSVAKLRDSYSSRSSRSRDLGGTGAGGGRRTGRSW